MMNLEVELDSIDDVEAWASEQAKLISSSNFLPLKTMYVTESAASMFSRLEQHTSTVMIDSVPWKNVLHCRNKYITEGYETNKDPLVFYGESNMYATMDCITDLFTERQRLEGRRHNKAMSPVEFMRDVPSVQRILVAGITYHKRMDTTILRTELMRELIECTPFRPSLAVDIVRYFQARDVLDPCAGWGDRLIGCLAAHPETRYTGYDPNPALVAGHRRIIDSFGRHRARVIQEPFETARLVHTYDLVFTSFPFYDVEVYTTAPGQSIDMYPTFEGWVTNFLFRSLRNAYNALRTNGTMVIHLSDNAHYKVCERMVEYCVRFLYKCEFVGRAYATVNKKGYHPLWIFRRNE